VKDYDIIITVPAEQDLREIIGDIVRKHQETPLQEINNIRDKIYALDTTPFSNTLVSDERLVTTGIRKIIIDEYIIFYIASEKDKTVSVIRVLRLHRQWENLL
jgi:plasmid stabilization system protein ParE